jgi:hypothetical protein
VEESFFCCFGVGVGAWGLGSVIAEGAMVVVVMMLVVLLVCPVLTLFVCG